MNYRLGASNLLVRFGIAIAIAANCGFLIAQSVATPTGDGKTPSLATKWHPGHYILRYPKQKEPEYFYSVMLDLRATPVFRGVQKKYFWNKLEPQKGVYDFSEVKSDLANLARINKQLILTVQAQSFITSEKLVPEYLLADEYEGGVYPINTGRGFNVAYYNTPVQDRLIALVQALGREFDQHPNLEAINFEETSPSRNEPE